LRYRAEDAAVFRSFSVLALLIALFLPIMIVFFKAFMRPGTQKYLAGPPDEAARTPEKMPQLLPSSDDLTSLADVTKVPASPE
jgi:hypothetical protein